MAKRTPFYEVKDILSLKYVDNKQYCLVWWTNYPKQQATWQPIENMTFLKDWQQYYLNLKKTYLKQQSPQEGMMSQVQSKKEVIKKVERLQREVIEQMPPSIKKIPKLTLSSEQISFTNFINKPGVQNSKRVKKEKPQRQQNPVKEAQIQQWIQSKNQEQFNNNYAGTKEKILVQQYSSSYENEPLEIQQLEDKSRQIKKQRVRYGNLKGRVIQLRPLSIDLQLKKPKELNFMDKNISEIKGSFLKKGQIWYEVELEGVTVNKNIILHNKYIKLLWPRKLAEYLLTKIKHRAEN